jgi:hypothetical protein
MPPGQWEECFKTSWHRRIIEIRPDNVQRFSFGGAAAQAGREVSAIGIRATDATSASMAWISYIWVLFIWERLKYRADSPRLQVGRDSWLSGSVRQRRGLSLQMIWAVTSDIMEQPPTGTRILPALSMCYP